MKTLMAIVGVAWLGVCCGTAWMKELPALVQSMTPLHWWLLGVALYVAVTGRAAWRYFRRMGDWDEIVSASPDRSSGLANYHAKYPTGMRPIWVICCIGSLFCVFWGWYFVSVSRWLMRCLCRVFRPTYTTPKPKKRSGRMWSNPARPFIVPSQSPLPRQCGNCKSFAKGNLRCKAQHYVTAKTQTACQDSYEPKDAKKCKQLPPCNGDPNIGECSGCKHHTLDHTNKAIPANTWYHHKCRNSKGNCGGYSVCRSVRGTDECVRYAKTTENWTAASDVPKVLVDSKPPRPLLCYDCGNSEGREDTIGLWCSREQHVVMPRSACPYHTAGNQPPDDLDTSATIDADPTDADLHVEDADEDCVQELRMSVLDSRTSVLNFREEYQKSQMRTEDAIRDVKAALTGACKHRDTIHKDLGQLRGEINAGTPAAIADIAKAVVEAVGSIAPRMCVDCKYCPSQSDESSRCHAWESPEIHVTHAYTVGCMKFKPRFPQKSAMTGCDASTPPRQCVDCKHCPKDDNGSCSVGGCRVSYEHSKGFGCFTPREPAIPEARCCGKCRWHGDRLASGSRTVRHPCKRPNQMSGVSTHSLPESPACAHFSAKDTTNAKTAESQQ